MTTKIRAPKGLKPLWDTEAPGLALPKLERYHVTPGKDHHLICVSSRVVTVRTHYVDDRTQVCSGMHGSCWYAPKCTGKGGRWNGWLAVVVPGHEEEEPLLVTITKVTVKEEPKFGKHGPDLRGQRIILWRKGETLRTRLLGSVEGQPYTGKLPDQPDLYAYVQRLLEAEDRDHKAEIAAMKRDERLTSTTFNKIEHCGPIPDRDALETLIDVRNNLGQMPFDPNNTH